MTTYLASPHLSAAPQLRAPVWLPQEGETALESDAWCHYLARRSQAAVCGATGLSAGDVSAIAVRWVWHARALEYDRSIIAAGWEARAARAKAVLVERAEAMSEVVSETTKYLRRESTARLLEAERAPAGVPAGTTIDFVRILAANSELARDLQAMATPFEAAAASGDVDFDRLTPEQLAVWEETVRTIRRSGAV